MLCEGLFEGGAYLKIYRNCIPCIVSMRKKWALFAVTGVNPFIDVLINFLSQSCETRLKSIHTRTWTHAQGHAYTRTHAHMYTRTSMRDRPRTHAHYCKCMQARTCMHDCKCTHECTRMHDCTCTHAHTL